MREIRRARMERNVESLGSVGLALVAHAYAKLQAGKRDEAEQEFRAAVALAPGLPDAHAGLSLALLRKGPLAIPSSLDASVAGVSRVPRDGARRAQRARPRDVRGAARRPSPRPGRSRSRCSSGTAACCSTTSRSGWARRTTAPPRSRSSCCCCCCRSRRSRAGAGCRCGGWRCCSPTSRPASGCSRASLALSALLVGPAVALVEERLRTTRNPLYHAALATTESVPDAAAIASLEAGAAAGPGGPRPRVPGRRRPQEGRPLRRGGRALPPGARGRPAGRRRAQQPREHRVRARRLRRGERALPGGHELRRSRRWPRPRTTTSRSRTCRSSTTRPTTRPSRTRTASRRASSPTTTAGSTTRASTRSWTSASGASRCSGKFAGAESGVAARNLLLGEPPAADERAAGGAAQPLRRLARRSSRWPASWSRAGAGARPSRCTAGAAAPPSAGCATWGR